MSKVIKTVGFFYPMVVIKSDEEAERYFKKFIPDLIEEYSDLAEMEFDNKDFLNIVSLFTKLNTWLPFRDIKGNWAWIKYIHNEETIDDTNIQFSANDFIGENGELNNLIQDVTGAYDYCAPSNFYFFAIDWWSGTDFPLIVK